MIPSWLHVLAVASLGLAVACALVIAVDLLRRPEAMAIMNVVWPVAALFGSLPWLAFYWRERRAAADPHAPPRPFLVQVAKATSHCGSGCTLGDIVAESWALASPSVLVLFGWQSLFPDKTFASWGLDFALAYLLGIVFQYWTIAPMRHLGLAAGLWAAVKADTLSLLAWQVGMYGGMAIAKFLVFRRLLGVELDARQPEFWFAMQAAMCLGFIASSPVNAWLLRRGWKESM